MKRQIFAVAVMLFLATAPSATAQQNGFDAQFIDSTEYLISATELRWNGDYAAVGRIQALPTATLRGQAQFLVAGQGSGWEPGDRVWTNHYFRTRMATRADLVEGKPVFCLNETDERGVFRGPRNRLESTTSGWWATTITDVSGIERGEVRAGRSRLNISCLRVLR